MVATSQVQQVGFTPAAAGQYNQGYSQYNQGQGLNQGYNQNLNQGYNQGINQGYNQGYNQDYNQGVVYNEPTRYTQTYV